MTSGGIEFLESYKKVMLPAEMPEGPYLEDGKLNTIIWNNTFFVYIYMLFSNIINTILKVLLFHWH